MIFSIDRLLFCFGLLIRVFPQYLTFDDVNTCMFFSILGWNSMATVPLQCPEAKPECL